MALHGITAGADGLEEARRTARVRGVEILGDAELILLLMGPGRGSSAGSCQALLSRAGGIRGISRASTRELALAAGVGEARALRVQAALELGRRAALIKADDGSPVRSSADVHARLAPRVAQLMHEVFMALGLDVRGRIVSEHRIAEGGLDECAVNPRDVFRPLLKCGACSCIVAHNHPSGDPAPSTQDRLLSVRMAEAGRLLGLRVLDHVIIASGGWYSFRDEGVI
jgi:DNA repair protein RadC